MGKEVPRKQDSEGISEEPDEASKPIRDNLGVNPVSLHIHVQTYVGRGLDTRCYVPLIAAKFETGRLR